MHDAIEVIAPLQDPIGRLHWKTGRWSQLPLNVASFGSTTRSPTLILHGWTHITLARLCFIGLIREQG
jgi:hypothetical protein